MEFQELKDVVESFSSLTLSSKGNSSKKYNTMVWTHSLSHNKIGIINEINIPNYWKLIFPLQSSRILAGFLANLKEDFLKGLKLNDFYFHIFPMKECETESYIKNLGNDRKLIDFLKYIPFNERMLYDKDIIDIISRHHSLSKKFLYQKTHKYISNTIAKF